MSTTEKPVDLDAIDALEREATPGDWFARTNRHPETNGDPWGWVDIDGGPGGATRTLLTWSGSQNQRNARIAAALRNAYPAMRDELRALRERVDKAEARVRELEAVLALYLAQYPCNGDGDGIHATMNNKRTRCPEESDDPEEWCFSAKFRKALAGKETP